MKLRKMKEDLVTLIQVDPHKLEMPRFYFEDAPSKIILAWIKPAFSNNNYLFKAKF